MDRSETEKSHIVVLMLPWQPIYQDKNLKYGLHTNLQRNLSKIIIWSVGEHLLLNDEIIETMEVIVISLIGFSLIKVCAKLGHCSSYYKGVTARRCPKRSCMNKSNGQRLFP